MGSESKALAWVANLYEQLNTFFSLPDAIFPQAPLEYIEEKFITTSESLKEFCDELVKDVLPLFTDGCPDEHGPTSPRMEENIKLLPQNESNLDSVDDRDGSLSVSFSSSSSSLASEHIDIHVCKDFESESYKSSTLTSLSEQDVDGHNAEGPSVEEVDFDPQVNSSTSVQCSKDIDATLSMDADSVESIHSSESMHAREHSRWDWDDEFWLDSDMEADRRSCQKTKISALDESVKKLCGIFISEGFDVEKDTKEWEEVFVVEKDTKEWEEVDKDASDIEWEIV